MLNSSDNIGKSGLTKWQGLTEQRRQKVFQTTHWQHVKDCELLTYKLEFLVGEIAFDFICFNENIIKWASSFLLFCLQKIVFNLGKNPLTSINI